MQTTLNAATADPAAKLWCDRIAIFDGLAALGVEVNPHVENAAMEHANVMHNSLTFAQPTTLEGIAACLHAVDGLVVDIMDFHTSDMEREADDAYEAVKRVVQNAIAGLEAMGATVPR